ncbi:MAG: hypothetical protein Q7U97_01870, partial [Rhodocyclaceae bacterium]|nr:hypothetical protein [Rhodocyclaceae bacterium]
HRLQELDGTFLRRRREAFVEDPDGYIDWVHPSFRDLVIDELADDLQLQERYWRSADALGVAIALSESGGAAGNRRWPLLAHEHSWTWFGDCCERLASTADQSSARQLMAYLIAAWKQEDITLGEKNLLLPVYSRVLQAVAARWATDLCDVSESTVKLFAELCGLSGIGAPMPGLAPIFEMALINLEVMADQELIQDPDELDQFLRVAVLLKDYQPSWFSVPINAVRLERALRLIETAVAGELQWKPNGEKADVISGQVENLRSISGTLMSIQRFLDANNLPKLAENLADRCDSCADVLDTQAAEAEQHEESMPTRAGGKDVEPFNIVAFFADL